MKKIYVTLMLSFIVAAAFAQSVIVNDINPGTGNGNPAEIFIFNNTLYFAADDANADIDHGKEIWRSDGTEAGTVLIKDIRTGTNNSSPYDFFVHNNELYFNANDGNSSVYKTDGTEGGTVEILDNSIASSPVELNGITYAVFTTRGNTLHEFSGTSLDSVTDLGAGSETVIAGNMIPFNNKLLLYMNYSTDDATTGNELYEYDPASDAFTLIKDIDEGSGDASISNFTILGSKVYFEADNALWETDGTTIGTDSVQAAQDAAILGINNIFAWNDLLFFEGDDGTGDQLWVYDPTAGSVTNISNLTGANTNHDPSDYCVAGDYLYYRGEDKNNADGHLWRTDGTTIELVDSIIKDVDEIVYLNGVLYFEAEDTTGTTTGNELFKFDLRKSVEFTVTDGTNPIEGATVTLTGYDAVTTNASGVATVSNVLPESNIAYTITKADYFEVNGNTSVADENVSETVTLQQSVSGELELVKDINTGTSGSNPAEIFVFNNEIYFAADDANAETDHGKEVWKSDGTEAGTVLVKDIRTGTSNSSPYDFFVYNNELYFNANDGNSSVYKTDGTEGGTVEILDNSIASSPVELNGITYAVFTTRGNTLHEFSGTSLDSVTDLGAGSETVIAGNMIPFNNKLLLYMNYSTDDATTGNELYEYDPASDAFTLIKDIDEGTGDASISNFTILGSKVYFEADNALWETDGTEGNTVAVAAASSVDGVKSFYAWNDKLYFEGDDGTGDQLWVYDPAGGTISKLSDISGSNTNHDPVHFVAYRDYIYYAGKDEFDAKYHLYKTDGASIEVVDNNTVDIDDIVLMNNTLYFEGEVDNGNELYKLYIGGYYDVTFTVTDGTNPIEGATVTLTGYEAATTNASGIATISNVTVATDLAYTVSFDGYDSYNSTVTILDQNVSENVALDLTTYDVTFTVTDGTNALQGATVTLTGYNAVSSDASGVATVSGVVPATDIAYTVSLTDYDDVNGTVTVTDANVNENVTMQIQTGIEDITQEFVKVYPIPTNGKITIETEEINASYTIYDVCGKVVEKMAITETLTRVDLSAYNKGIYLIEITSENKRNIQRIILQ